MSISSRKTKSENSEKTIYYTLDPDVLPKLKEGETLHVHQEVGSLRDNEIKDFFGQITTALRYFYPNNLVIVSAKRHGVNEAEIEVEQGVKTVPVQLKDKNDGSYWFD